MNTRNKEYLELLKQSFNESKYIDFIKDLLNLDSSDFNTDLSEKTTSNKQYKDDIKSYKYIAKYNDGLNNIGIFIVNLKSTKARNLQRNFVASLLNNFGLDASIVSFYSDNDTSWRLSFVKKELTFSDNGVKESLTPAKRYSFLVGENESVHTAQEFLFKLLQIDSRKITLEDIEKVFDVEKVAKQFFEEYKEKYLQLKEYLDKNEDFITESQKCDFTSVEFAKKLMGQIVFLYFLQKKGWLGVQLVPNELSVNEFRELLSSNDSVSQNLINMFYEFKEEKYLINKNNLRQADNQDVINFTNIFVKTKYDKPWGTGAKDFIRSIYKQSRIEHKNFFDEYLEQFFYKGLNEKRDNQYFTLFNCKIPFLNGGLFEPLNNYRWSSAHFSIPNDIFSNDKKDGILDFLDLYNFTIDEEEPLEKDVAVDPEMLGKIFENLLDINDRKSKGAFYTPREIVYYMCQESLANYLVNKVGVDYDEIIQFIKYGDLISHIDWELSLSDNTDFTIGKTIYNNLLSIDKALMEVKVADPAVGSGAFPLGILTEIVKIRNNISTYLTIQCELNLTNINEISAQGYQYKDIYNLKRDTIEKCIYAVDVETSAIDITKLRLWLSLIVDYPNDEEPQPLPNLDCKIMQGNSLIDEYKGVPLFSEKMLSNNLKNYKRNESQINSIRSIYLQQSLFEDSKTIDTYMQTMLDLQKEYFITTDNKLKKELKRQIDNIQLGLIEESLKESPQKLKEFKEESNKRQKSWFVWKLEFYDVFKYNGGFDIVIGNPPYIKEGKNSDIFKDLKSNKYYKGKMDFWYFFTCVGLDLLKRNGTLCFIAPNNWITSFGASIMRNKILKESEIKKFIDFNDFMVFDSASIQTMIMLLNKEYKRKYYIDYRKVESNKFNQVNLNNLLNLNCTDKSFINETIEFNSNDYIDEYIQFTYGINGRIINKIKNKGKVFITKEEISQGIVMPQDVLNKKNAEILGLNKDEGIFILNHQEKLNIGFNEIEHRIIKPYYTSNNIHKYWFDENNANWIIYTDKNVISQINNYPNIKKHLDKYAKVITSDNKPYGLHRPRNRYFFEGEKIICFRKCLEPTFCYVKGSSYVSQTYNIIKPNFINIKYLCALLNSNLIKYWLKKCGKLQGNNYQLDSEPLMKIPISECSKEDEKRIIELIDNIIESNGEEKKYIRELDEIIYKIYCLTSEEINYIEKEIS